MRIDDISQETKTLSDNLKKKRVTVFAGIAAALLLVCVILLALGYRKNLWHTHAAGYWKAEETDLMRRHTECIYCGKVMEERIVTGTHAYDGKDIVTDVSGTYIRYSCVCGDYYAVTADCENIGLPVLHLTGELKKATKKKAVTLQAVYESEDRSFTSDVTMKVQGGTSEAYDKKNYTVKFVHEDGSKNSVKLNSDWGKHSKYCLKANWIDTTQARNIVSATIWGQITKTRKPSDPIDELIHGGAIDGYPVVVTLNGEFLGLYTMNIPKDEWLFGLKDGDKDATTNKQAAVFQNSWSDSGKLYEPIASLAKEGWKVEYNSTAEEEWISESLNEMIGFLGRCSKDEFMAEIKEYTSLERAIDVMLFTYLIKGKDNTSKNIIWVTYDGSRWLPSVYDLDGTWGLEWDGSLISDASEYPIQGENALFDAILQFCPERLYERYRSLRENVLSEDSLTENFRNFIGNIPDYVYEAERFRWPEAPSPDGQDADGIAAWIHERLQYFDGLYGDMHL